MSLLPSGFGAKSGAGQFYPYEINGSLRFNDDDSAYLSRTPASAGNRKTWTWSGWVKRGNLTTGGGSFLFRAEGATTSDTIRFDGDFTIQFFVNDAANGVVKTSALLRDVSAWYHIVVIFDSTNATSDDRMQIWLNGVRQSLSTNTQPPLNTDSNINNNVIHYLGHNSTSTFDGYLTEVSFIDGQALSPTDFGEFKNGIWIPKAYTGTYGTNGFYLPLTTDANDASGNGNNWTATNIAASDYLLDSPTNNWAVLNPLEKFVAGSPATVMPTYSEGNLKAVGDNYILAKANFAISSGKWYWETVHTSSSTFYVGVCSDSTVDWNTSSAKSALGGLSTYLPLEYTSTSFGASVGSTASGNIIGIAVDADAGEAKYYVNNSLVFTDSTLPTDGTIIRPMLNTTFFGTTQTHVFNFGQDATFAGNKTPQGNTDANGVGDFYYAPPAGYLALCSSNLPEPTIGPNSATQADQHFNTVLYTGTGVGVANTITGVGFQPDFTWIKNRTSANSHGLNDVVRGAGQFLYSDLTNAEGSFPTVFESFDADGFSLGTGSGNVTNTLNNAYVAWNWLADNTSGSSNTDGTITSTVAANTTAGFSIVNCTAPASGDFTVGHGLTQTPDLIIAKDRETAGTNWHVWFGEWTNVRDYMLLNTTAAKTTQPTTNVWGSAVPTSSVFGMTAGSLMVGGKNTIAYCFHSVPQFSKCFSYSGNGSADGSFVFLDFEPAFILLKRTDATGNWTIIDNQREGYNVDNDPLYPNLSNAEGTTDLADILSNGFKLRTTDTSVNASGGTYIGYAVAENPFKYANAR